MEYEKRKELVREFLKQKSNFDLGIGSDLDTSEILMLFVEWLDIKRIING